jgi:hypothetical protein
MAQQSMDAYLKEERKFLIRKLSHKNIGHLAGNRFGLQTFSIHSRSVHIVSQDFKLFVYLKKMTDNQNNNIDLPVEHNALSHLSISIEN